MAHILYLQGPLHLLIQVEDQLKGVIAQLNLSPEMVEGQIEITGTTEDHSPGLVQGIEVEDMTTTLTRDPKMDILHGDILQIIIHIEDTLHTDTPLATILPIGTHPYSPERYYSPH